MLRRPARPEQVAAEDLAGRQRIWPAIRGLSGLVGIYVLRGSDLSSIVVTLATSVDTLDAAQQAVMATELTPGEDPALLPGPAQPGAWVADLAACTASFTVRNFGLRSVTGQIPLVSVTVTVGPGGQPVGVRAELDARGIDTGHRRRDSDLRGTRFLAADRWPAITFEASYVQASGPGWTIDGTLTVKDCQCPVRLTVNGPDVTPDDPTAPVSLYATARLDRRSAGVTAAPAFLIGHMISLSLAVRLRPPVAIPGTSGRRVPGTKSPAKEDHR